MSTLSRRIHRLPRPTLLGRAVVLIGAELLANAACWIAAGICLSQADGLIGLALLAWTLGLRHGLDADHISAIDNATRQMVSLGRQPLTCGLFFSLGHSTIVIAVNIAIAVSVDIYDKLGKVGSVGGIVGTSVSASFLFLVASINTFFLIGAIKDRRRAKAREAAGLPPDEVDPAKIHGGGCLVRVIAPILRVVDRPWKMYPVGILFGFGFDTASSIALLAISAIATRGPNGEAISHGKIIILPFLFTAGMSLVDSLDSVLMLYAYAQPDLRSGPDRKIRLFSRYDQTLSTETLAPLTAPEGAEAFEQDVEGGAAAANSLEAGKDMLKPASPESDGTAATVEVDPETEARTERAQRLVAAKTATMSSLSISLTLLSILVALSISLIEIMGLIGENCTQCSAAADDPDGGGLAGSWWRAWARANDASGYVGAAIVGCFVAILAGYHVVKWGWRRHQKKNKVAGQERESSEGERQYGATEV